MSIPKVAFFTSLGKDMIHLVHSSAPSGWDNRTVHMATSDEHKIAVATNADFILLFPGILSGAVLRESKKVKLVQSLTAGYDRIDLDTAKSLSIPVANNGGANSIAVSEHTVLLILAVYRRLGNYLTSVRSGDWPRTGNILPDTYELEGKTVGIIGFGAIGRQVARRLSGFGVQIVYYDPYVHELDQGSLGLKAVPCGLSDLLHNSDVVSIHTPLTRGTRHLIGTKELSLMKPSAIIINTSRGPVIDQSALYAALTTGVILGAGLDVLEVEPPDPRDPILSLDNVVITPHQAGPTYESFAKRSRNAYENMQRVWNGEAPLWVASFD